MSRQYVEDTGPTVRGSGCSYASLGSYNQAGRNMGVPHRSESQGVYIVPVFGSTSYSTLTHDSQGSCSGYFDIDGAYGGKGGSCSQRYAKKLCQ